MRGLRRVAAAGLAVIGVTSVKTLRPLTRVFCMLILLGGFTTGAPALSSAQSDTTASQLAHLSFSPTTMNVSESSQTVNVRLRVTDELSGFDQGAVFFRSPSGQSRASGFGPGNRALGDELDGTYEVPINVPQFSEAGTYHLVYLDLYDRVGNNRTWPETELITLGFATTLLVTANEPPTANAGADHTVIAGEAVSFDGSASSDSDGTVTAWDWDFGDGSTGTGASVAQTYTAAGQFTLTLTVTDNQGTAANDTAVITVLTPSGAVLLLAQTVQSFNFQQGIANSLDQKLENVQEALQAANANQRQDAANKLLAFINAAEAQRNNQLSNEQANILIAMAQRILGVL